ncbi:hypothetical protein HK101_001829 [Irineochytrium annulatum]|nr:hypothetical protein HK101_001829 [Irineochytrium annulatum]
MDSTGVLGAGPPPQALHLNGRDVGDRTGPAAMPAATSISTQAANGTASLAAAPYPMTVAQQQPPSMLQPNQLNDPSYISGILRDVMALKAQGTTDGTSHQEINRLMRVIYDIQKANPSALREIRMQYDQQQGRQPSQPTHQQAQHSPRLAQAYQQQQQLQVPNTYPLYQQQYMQQQQQPSPVTSFGHMAHPQPLSQTPSIRQQTPESVNQAENVGPQSPPLVAFTDAQREALRYQIFAYKAFTNKSPLPSQMVEFFEKSHYSKTGLDGKPLPPATLLDESSDKPVAKIEVTVEERVGKSSVAPSVNGSSTHNVNGSLNIPVTPAIQSYVNGAGSSNYADPTRRASLALSDQSVMKTPSEPSALTVTAASAVATGLPDVPSVTKSVPSPSTAIGPSGHVPKIDVIKNTEVAGLSSQQNQAPVKNEKLSVVAPVIPPKPSKDSPTVAKRPRFSCFVPADTPPGIDPIALVEERERVKRRRMGSRIMELESMKVEESLKSTGEDKPQAPVSLIIELKSLRLWQRQQQMRNDFAQFVAKSVTCVTALSDDYGRNRRQNEFSMRSLEMMEHDLKKEKERKAREKRIEFFANVAQIGTEVAVRRREREKAKDKFGASVLKYHIFAQKEEERRIAQLQEERMNALKANDEEAYLRLIDKAKDTRITQILSQTQSYLDKLSENIVNQKTTAAVEQTVNDDGDAAEESSSRLDYYSAAHKIQETVTAQSTLLVGGTLKEYQIKGLQWMVSLYNNRLNGILADEMGLGKTIQTISLITYLIEKKKQNGPYLIIVPLGTITNWMVEFEKWAPSVSKIVFKGLPPERKRLAVRIKDPTSYQVLLTTYEYIINEKNLLSKIKWMYMIIDEGHRMKNSNSKLSTTLMQHYNTRYRVLLTGTPLQNNLPELWSLLNFILPKVFNSVQTFDQFFSSPFSSTAPVGQASAELTEEERLLMIKGLHKALRPFLLRRLKKDVESELPDKVETIIKCPMSALQRKITEHVKVEKTIGPFEIKGTKTLSNIVMQFRKICNHPFVFPEVEDAVNPGETMTNDMIYRVSGKFELLDRILPKLFKTGHRVLMFFQMTQVMDIIEDFFRYRDWKFLRMDGNIKSEDRGALLKDFNDKNSDYNLFILSTRAGGLGLNLQTADTVIIFDSDWNPHQDLQAQDRAHRIGQTKEVRILRLITTNSIEEHILAKAQQKLALDGKVIQAGKFDQKTSDKEREELLRLLFEKEETKEGDEEEENPELTDEQLNEILARGAHEVEIFAELDRERAEDEKARGCPPRLFTEAELPECYQIDFSKVKPKELSSVAAGPRERKNVRYDEVLTEDQWLEAVEEGNLNDIMQSKSAEVPRRARRSYKIAEEEEEDQFVKADEEEEEDDFQGDDAGEGEPAKKRRGRPPKGGPKLGKRAPAKSETPKNTGKRRGRKAKAKEDPEDIMEEEPVRKRNKKAHNGDKLSPASRTDLRKRFRAVLDAVSQLMTTRPDGDYFEVIDDPICLEDIELKTQGQEYESLADLERDLDKMFDNARTYNQEGSEIVNDADELQRLPSDDEEEEEETYSRPPVPTARRRSAAAPSVASPGGAPSASGAKGATPSRPMAKRTRVELPFAKQNLPRMRIRRREPGEDGSKINMEDGEMGEDKDYEDGEIMD